MVSRSPSPAAFFLYDLDGNLIAYSSKGLKISYDWRGMSIEFTQYAQPTGSSDNSLFRLSMAYDESGYIPNVKFEWYLKNNLGSTMLVYGTVSSTDPNIADIGETKAAYDYRAFGEQMSIVEPADKVTENFTGKEHDDEIELNYFGARYLDPMLGLWISVDPKRQFSSPYLYTGNGVNPVNGVDPDGNELDELGTSIYNRLVQNDFWEVLF